MRASIKRPIVPSSHRPTKVFQLLSNSSFAFAQLLGVQEFRSSGVTDDSAEGSLSVILQGLEVLSELLYLLLLDLWSLCLQRTPELHQLAKVELSNHV